MPDDTQIAPNLPIGTALVTVLGKQAPLADQLAAGMASGGTPADDTPVRIQSNITAYVFLAANKGRTHRFEADSTITATVPLGFPAGWNCLVTQRGNGQVRVIGATGVSVASADGFVRTAKRNAVIGVVGDAQDQYLITGQAS